MQQNVKKPHHLVAILMKTKLDNIGLRTLFILWWSILSSMSLFNVLDMYKECRLHNVVQSCKPTGLVTSSYVTNI